MVEFDGARDMSGGASDDEDDIARFERQCAERARAEGLAALEEGEDNALSDDEQDEHIRKVRLAAGLGQSPTSSDEWRAKCAQLQERLARKDAELNQVRADLEMVRSDGLGPNDPGNELKQRLLDLSKKNKRLQVTTETQKTRIQQLEAEVKKPREEARRQAEELVMKNTDAVLGDGMEDWKKKYLAASNKLQEVRHEVQDLRVQLQRQKKVLLKELGSDEALERALSVADDPQHVQWKGRAAQISQLQRQVRELKDQLRRPGPPAAEDVDEAAGGDAQRPQRSRADQIGEKESKAIAQAAEKRREEFERLQEEAEKLRSETVDVKKKRDALKSRNDVLQSQLRDLKAGVQDLLRKSENDDALVAVLRRQLGRHGPGGANILCSEGSAEEVEALRQENAELQQQLERQAQIVVNLRQKNLANTCENGSARLGPKSVESSTSERQLVDRVRYLEAENAKQLEHVKLLQGRVGDDAGDGGGRPFSVESSLDMEDELGR